MGREIVLHTNLSQEKALERLSSSVSPWPEWWQIFVNWHPFDEPEDEYIGTMNGKSFTISILWHSHGFRRGPSIYRLKGSVLPDDAGEGALIGFKVTEFPWPAAVLAMVLILFFAVRSDSGTHDAFKIAAGMGVAWSLFALFARSLYKGDDEMMIGFLEKTLEAREVEKPMESPDAERG